MAKLRNFDWRQEAKFLMDSRDKNLWQEQKSSSFSDWLKKRAATDGIKISALWRYLRAGHFAVELQDDEWAKVKSPLDIPDGINADSIELLEKINRVATKADFNALAVDLYQKKISRPQLLKTWQIYREAMPPGQTARGRGVKRPVLSEADENKHRIAFIQKVLGWLETTDPVALGYEKDVELRVFNNISERKKRRGYDAILLVLKEQAVIDAALVVFDQVGRRLAPFKKERVWLITSAEPVSETAAEPKVIYPEPWGAIGADAKTMRVLKKIPSNPALMPLPLSELLLDLI